MKYFCGIQATGRGHLSRYLVVRDILERAGHEVFGFASGQSLPAYASGIDRFEQGPSFFVRNNRIDFAASFVYNAKCVFGFYRTVFDLTRRFRQGDFAEAIIDFEPISARAACRAQQRFTIFDNQTIALLDFPYPREVQRAVSVLRQFVRYYYRSVERARRVLTYSFAPVKPQLAGQRIIPPCVRRQVLETQPTAGGHLLFYSSIGNVPDGLIDFARNNPTVEIRAYVPQSKRSGSRLPTNLLMPDADGAHFLDDFASCRVFVANAGFESLAEAICLRKPVVIVPIEGQWEQQMNGFLIRHFGIGKTAETFAEKTFMEAMRHETPPSSEVREWVAQGRPMLEQALLSG